MSSAAAMASAEASARSAPSALAARSADSGAGRGHRHQPGAGDPNGMGVDPADEAGAGDRHPQLISHDRDPTATLFERQAKDS